LLLISSSFVENDNDQRQIIFNNPKSIRQRHHAHIFNSIQWRDLCILIYTDLHIQLQLGHGFEISNMLDLPE